MLGALITLAGMNAAGTAAINAKQAKYASREAQKQRDWAERMANTAHQREVEDLKAAGLNPILSAGGQGASTPNGASAQANFEDPVSSGISAGLNAFKELVNLKAVNADSNLKEAQAANTAVQTELAPEQLKLQQGQLAETIRFNNGQLDLFKTQGALNNANTSRVVWDTTKGLPGHLDNETKKRVAEVKNLEALTAQSNSATAFNDQKRAWYDAVTGSEVGLNKARTQYFEDQSAYTAYQKAQVVSDIANDWLGNFAMLIPGAGIGAAGGKALRFVGKGIKSFGGKFSRYLRSTHGRVAPSINSNNVIPQIYGRMYY